MLDRTSRALLVDTALLTRNEKMPGRGPGGGGGGGGKVRRRRIDQYGGHQDERKQHRANQINALKSNHVHRQSQVSSAELASDGL
jgi:hypothetical protein